jgi:hypothetical protein
MRWSLMDSPQFTHDCDYCLFIGRVERGEGVWRQGSRWGVEDRTITWPAGDLWLCPGGSIIVRTGSDGPDYHSMGDAYMEALPVEWRAIARALWRHNNKPDDFDYERMRKARTVRRQDRRMVRQGKTPWMERMTALPTFDCEDN